MYLASRAVSRAASGARRRLHLGRIDRHGLAIALARDQRQVRFADEVVEANRPAAVGNSRRDTDAPWREHRLQPLGGLQRIPLAAVVDDHRELVAADPVRAVTTAEALAQGPGQRLQAFVAGLVPASVVDGLEIVEVDHDQGEPASGANPTLQITGQVLVKGAMVVQSGEGVGQRGVHQPLELGPVRAPDPAPQPQQERCEPGEQQQPGRERNRDRGPCGRRAIAQTDRGPSCPGGRDGAVGIDRSLDGSEDRIDELVVEIMTSSVL